MNEIKKINIKVIDSFKKTTIFSKCGCFFI